MTNLAFNNDPTLAAAVRTQVEGHTKADEIIQGEYWENGKGCFIGCIAHDSDPLIVEQLTGFPIMLTRIAESIFEGLPNEVAKGFPQRVINAPKIGADLSLVSWKFLHWLVDGVLKEHSDDATRTACQATLDVVAAKARGEEVDAAAALAAADAAYAADAAAADAAYYAASAASADSVAHAADAAAASTAAAACDVELAGAAADAARVKQADKLIELLAAA